MKNRDTNGNLRKHAMAAVNLLIINCRGKWKGRGTVGAFGRCHNRPVTEPVTDPRFNHALRPAHIERARLSFAAIVKRSAEIAAKNNFSLPFNGRVAATTSEESPSSILPNLTLNEDADSLRVVPEVVA